MVGDGAAANADNPGSGVGPGDPKKTRLFSYSGKASWRSWSE